MKKQLPKRLLSLLLIAAMCVGLVLPVGAVEPTGEQGLTYEQIDNSAVSAPPSGLVTVPEERGTAAYAPTDVVRVSIVLSGKSTLEMASQEGISTASISSSDRVSNYRNALETSQRAMAHRISTQVLKGEKLDVVWNLTLATNIISANVPYGKIEEIEKIPGVERVLLENRYEPAAEDQVQVADPNMSTSTTMIGTSHAYASGYTGAGTRIAIIDTGLDSDHEALSPEGLEYSLAQLAGEEGQNPEQYIDSLDLLDAEEIASVLPQLNVSKRGEFTADELYINTKIPFGFNYIDADTDSTHDNDSQSSHGSHVGGIAAANAYVPNGDGTFSKALDKVLLQGVAPDAQLFAMKIFGKKGGAYEADYMAAIEDAIILGADVVNISIGTTAVGFNAFSSEYQSIIDGLQKSEVYVSISAGNNGAWPEETRSGGYLYSDDVSMASGGTPGTYSFSMSTASVDNVGYTDRYLTVHGKKVFYGESAYGWFTKTLAEIAGDYEYVLIDGYGSKEDFEAVADVLPGKIAVCCRGGGVTFSQKATNAVACGAVATIVYNNEPNEMFYISLDIYWDEEPCVSVTQETGDWMRSSGVPVTDSQGNVLYYKGNITVNDDYTAVSSDPDFYTMSDFSSWGVPGSLTLKPEITAPGGNIFSIDGETAGGKSYEVMSGTSMAAPHGAGMAALVAQYIRENGLEEKTGLTARQLSQSLLMSTSIPVREEANGGAYYSILKQGSGLANVGAAIGSGSYILMDGEATASASDGKVKAELGDDPDRTGTYSFSFTVNDMTGTDRAFALSAELFTQALFTEDGISYMDKLTAPLDASFTWQVDGKTVTPDASLAGLDFDGDGDVDTADGQALLDYATGVGTELHNKDRADLDLDGNIDSHDAYLFFTKLHAGAVLVPANGSAKVTVTASLTQEQKVALDKGYENGAYVEGYVFVKAITTEEGLIGETHSIPVLGFYGNWSDPSMFDVGTGVTYQTGEETRKPYMGDETANAFGVLYTNDPGYIYAYCGNPIVSDETYFPERNAINSVNGDKIAKVYFSAIRNAAESHFTITNTDTGDVLLEEFDGPIQSAYFVPNTNSWSNTAYARKINWVPTGAAEGEHFKLTWQLAPEYYVSSDGSVDWDALGKGATLELPLVIDNTAPTVDDVALSITSNAITVIASDNQYVAAAALYDRSGKRLLAAAGAKQDIAPGERAVFQIPLDEVYGTDLILRVVDYAMNTVTYKLDMTLGEPLPLPQCLAFHLDDKYWFGFSADDPGNRELWLDDPTFIWSATMVDKMLFTGGRYGQLRIINTDDPYTSYPVGDMGEVITDMAYNKADGEIYGIVDRQPAFQPDGSPDSSTESTLVRINKYTAQVEDVGTIGVSTNTLACSNDGVFYCVGYETGKIYSFTLDTMMEPQLLTTVDSISAEKIQALAYDPNCDMLYWFSYTMTSFFYSKTGFIQIDPKTGEYSMYDQPISGQMCALVVPERDAVNGEWANTTDKVTQVLLSNEDYNLLQGATATLSVDLFPWNISDHSVIWTTSDPHVVTVDENGVLTGVGTGEAIVTATSVVDAEASASCKVVVNAVKTTLEGVMQDAEGTPNFFRWDLEHDSNWTAGTKLDTTLISATYNPDQNVLYAMESGNTVWNIHEIDMATGKTLHELTNTYEKPLWDMDYSTYWSTQDTPKIYGTFESQLILASDPADLANAKLYDMSTTLYQRTGAEILIAVANAGYARYSGKDCELFYVLDNTGAIWAMYSFEKDGQMDAYFKCYKSNLRDMGFRPDTVLDYQYSSMLVGEDGNLYLSAFNGSTNVIYHLAFNSTSSTYFASRLGDMGDDVWPAALYSAKSNYAATDAAVDLDDGTAELLSEAVKTSQTAADGGLNSVAYAEPCSAADGKDAKNVIVTVTAKDTNGTDVASTNGVAQLQYDENALTLKSIQVGGNYQSVKEETGSVTFGYVSLEELSAGVAVATLTFEVKDPTAAKLTVMHKETGNQASGFEEVLDLHEHTNTEIRNAKAATCQEDGYTGDVYCLDCGQLVQKGEVIPANCPSKVFKDVDQSKWYHEAIDFVVSKDLMFGITNDTFQPNGEMTRAQLVTVLYRLAGSPEVEGTVPFTDVQTGQFYSQALVWAYANDIAKGMTDDRFAPNTSVTREQMVTFFARFAKLEGKTVEAKGDLKRYQDADSVSNYAVESMTWAVETGLVKGMGKDILSPKTNSTRAQIAEILMRYCTIFR